MLSDADKPDAANRYRHACRAADQAVNEVLNTKRGLLNRAYRIVRRVLKQGATQQRAAALSHAFLKKLELRCPYNPAVQHIHRDSTRSLE